MTNVAPTNENVFEMVENIVRKKGSAGFKKKVMVLRKK